jgi:predicted MarR family transcription regulator
MLTKTIEPTFTGEDAVDQSYYKGWHLGGTHHDAMTTEFEWAMLRFEQAFQRFMLQIASMCGLGELSSAELVLLHVIRMQDGPKTAAVLARQLNIDGVTNVQYSLRKLLNSGFVDKIKGGNSKIWMYAVTERAAAMLDEYTRIRREMLTDQTKNFEHIDKKLYEAAKLISLLTGTYDEASRISATYCRVAAPADSEKSRSGK